jgi:DNA-binding NarL/FixJ family response regulator
MSITVVLADDHPIVRSGICAEIARHSDIRVVGEAVNGDEALSLSELLQPDVLVLDIRMDGMKAVHVLRAMREKELLTRVLVLTSFGDPENVRGMLRAGARGYALKDELPTKIVEAIRTVASGTTWLSAAVAEMLPNLAQEEPSLTDTELQTLRTIATGKKTEEICAELTISERTLRYRLRCIYDKIGVNSRSEAIAWAAQRGKI